MPVILEDLFVLLFGGPYIAYKYLSDKIAGKRINDRVHYEMELREKFVENYGEPHNPYHPGPIEKNVDRICGNSYDNHFIKTDPDYYNKINKYCMECLGDQFSTYRDVNIVKELIMAKDYGKISKDAQYKGYSNPRVLQFIFDNFNGEIKCNVLWIHDKMYDSCYDREFSDRLYWDHTDHDCEWEHCLKNDKRYICRKISYKELEEGVFRDWTPG